MVILERLPSATHPQVVRVRVSAEDPDFDAPWVTTPRDSEAIAVVVGPRLLVTLASAVTDAVEPTAPLGVKQVRARIKAIDHDRNLALLEVADGWAIEPATLAPLPAEGETVVLVGIGTGHIEVGAGRVVEIGLTRYAHSQRRLLSVTVDARQPLHPGGDAVFGIHGLVGLVMQKQSDEELRGELVAAPIIRAFLEGVADDKPPGVPALGIDVQTLENPLLRTQLGDRGVIVTRVDHEGTCDGIVEPRDVLLAIDGVPVDEEGNVRIEGRELRHYAVLGTRHIGNHVSLEIRRGGVARTVGVTLRAWNPLVPHGPVQARYSIYAGLVLQPLSRDLLMTWGAWWENAPKEWLHAYYAGRVTPLRRELVVVSSILEDPINVGYRHLINESIARVGGHMPRDFAHLVDLLDAARGDVLIETGSGGLIALDTEEVRQATSRIVRANRVPRDRI